MLLINHCGKLSEPGRKYSVRKNAMLLRYKPFTKPKLPKISGLNPPFVDAKVSYVVNDEEMQSVRKQTIWLRICNNIGGRCVINFIE